MWGTPMNKQEEQKKLMATDTRMVVKRGKGGLGGSKYVVTEEDRTLGGGYTMQYTDCVSQKCTLETYMIL